MKLGKVTTNDPLERQALSLPQSVVKQLQAYRAYYKSHFGEEISMSKLVEEIAKRFLKDDRDFHKYLEKHPNAGVEGK